MTNELLKREIKEARLYNYEIAAFLGVSEPTFYRLLRSELSSSKKEQIFKAIKELSQRRYELKQA